ncbi:MAG: NAD-dependent epimerase/dehydratase family protein [Candidatus Omnitrophica bacterium]|nr:NAD-dependent epimerase/dehydratase family protein [Candidatus Omnitrophota bacterium]
MKNDVLILGKGVVGTRLQKEFDCPISAKKIQTFADVFSIIEQHKPKVVINCIGHTGENNVDDCEKVLDKTMTANTFVPILLGEAALRQGFKLVHLSSGCIYYYNYGKQKPIPETRVPDYYRLYYSRTKLYIEHILDEMAKKDKRANILIPRVRVPLDNRPYKKNVLTKLIQYKRIIDVPNSVTYMPDFVKALKFLIKKDAKGIYNVVNKHGLKYSRLMKIYKKYVPEFEYEIIKLKQLNLDRTNLILSTKKLEETGFKVRSIDEVLEECVKEYVKY